MVLTGTFLANNTSYKYFEILQNGRIVSAGGWMAGNQQINTNMLPRPYSYLQTSFQRTRLNTSQAAAYGQDDSGWFSGSSKKFFVRSKYRSLPTANLGTLPALWRWCNPHYIPTPITKESKTIPVYAKKIYGEVDVWLHSFLTSALEVIFVLKPLSRWITWHT